MKTTLILVGIVIVVAAAVVVCVILAKPDVPSEPVTIAETSPAAETGNETASPASVSVAADTKESEAAAPAPVVPDDAAEEDSDVRDQVARFKDTSRPLEQRRRDIAILAKRGDARSVEILMALGDEETYLNWAAVEALGRCLDPEVTEYLKGKLNSEDTRVLTSAVGSYARQMGGAAVPELTALLKKNRTRADGWEEQVQTEIVKVLARMGETSVVPALAEELARRTEKGWSLEYGSVLVAALGRIGTPDAHTAITAYANGLAENTPEDPMAKKYYEDKIAEAKAAINGNIDESIFERKL